MEVAKSKEIISGWKQIAARLDTTPRNAQRMEGKGLPIQRSNGHSGPWIYVAELEAWRRRRREAPSVDPAATGSTGAVPELTGGALPLDSGLYIERPADRAFLGAIQRGDSAVIVRGPRATGKTSLLARGLGMARASGIRVVVTDLQKLNDAQLASAETLYLALADIIAEQLELEALPEDGWSARRSPNINFERFLRGEVLTPKSKPLVWGLDEVDRISGCSYKNEVFSLFRSWHSARALQPDGPWGSLTLAIAQAQEAHNLISDVRLSSFNHATWVSLEDFSPAEVADLNRRHGSPLAGPEDLARLATLVGGHPFLAQIAFGELSKGASLAALDRDAASDGSPFGPHLRRLLASLRQAETLEEGVRQALTRGSCPPGMFYPLRAAGVIVGEACEAVRLRCAVYERFLRAHLLPS